MASVIAMDLLHDEVASHTWRSISSDIFCGWVQPHLVLGLISQIVKVCAARLFFNCLLCSSLSFSVLGFSWLLWRRGCLYGLLDK